MKEIYWKPHPGAQTDFCESWQDEVLFGGAAGPGKTDCLIMEALRYIDHKDYRGIIFRRTHPEMLDILDRMHQAYPLHSGEYRAGENRWHFPSSAKIALGHMSDKDSHYLYQGKQYHYCAFDEAGQFLPIQILYLFSRTRTTNPNIPKRIRYASNPGGPSHQFLKDRFRIGQHPNGYKTYLDKINIVLDGKQINETVSRVFIPGRLKDNPTLIENDPQYVAYLYQLPEIERMRLLEGRWDAFEGQFFAEINREIHGFDGDLPWEWETFTAFDWGYARPWCYQVWRVDFDGRLWLDAMHYATREGFTNVGVRQTDTEIARQIREIEKNYPKLRWRVAGADIWSQKKRKDGFLGPAPAEEMAKEGIVFIRADQNRITGWQQIHHRLRPDDSGEPMLKVRNGLENWWRTMLNLQEDVNNPEDLPKKDIEDHIAECTRYAVMTHPIRPKVVQPQDHNSFQAERRRLIAAKNVAVKRGIPLDQAYRSVR